MTAHDVALGSPIEAARAALLPEAIGHVTLEDVMGDDVTIINAARTSLAKRTEWQARFECRVCAYSTVAGLSTSPICERATHGVLIARGTRSMLSADAGLLNRLMRDNHGTPFEMVVFRFHVIAPIRVLREWQRHRIGSFNEVSTRYVEMQPVVFVPSAADVRAQQGKAADYDMTAALTDEQREQVRHVMRDGYAHAWAYYQQLLQMGVAKELAAYMLPLGLFSQQIWCVNLRSLLNFVALRNEPHALMEIRRLAAYVEDLAANAVPFTMEAFRRNGRQVP